jgi:hypothetical protein
MASLVEMVARAGVEADRRQWEVERLCRDVYAEIKVPRFAHQDIDVVREGDRWVVDIRGHKFMWFGAASDGLTIEPVGKKIETFRELKSTLARVAELISAAIKNADYAVHRDVLLQRDTYEVEDWPDA